MSFDAETFKAWFTSLVEEGSMTPTVAADLHDAIAAGELHIVARTDVLDFSRVPVVRPMTVDDLEDDCPLCLALKARIENDDAPLALVIS